MKILIICKEFLPNIGGVSIMMHHLSNALADRNVDVLLAPPPDGEVNFQRKYQMAGGIRENWGRGKWYQRPFREARYRRQISSLVESFHPSALLLGDQAYTGQYAEAAVWAGRHYNIPIGAFCHGQDVRKKLMVPASTTRRTIDNILGPIAGRSSHHRVLNLLRSADWIFANSTYTAGLIRKLANRSSVVTGCGLDHIEWQKEIELTPSFDPRLKQYRRKVLGLGERPMISFLGRLVPRKNVGLLLEALTELNNTALVVMGEGPARPALEEKARKKGLEDRVIWLGPVSENRKWEILRASDILCLPATEGENGGVEGFGIVLLEAAAAGTPVVAAASGGMTDVVEDRVTGLLWNNSDSSELAEKLRQLISEPALAQNCVAKARDKIRKDFNWAKIAQNIIQTLKK